MNIVFFRIEIVKTDRTPCGGEVWHGITSGVSREKCTKNCHRRWGATWCYIGCFVRDILKQTYNTSPPQGVTCAPGLVLLLRLSLVLVLSLLVLSSLLSLLLSLVVVVVLSILLPLVSFVTIISLLQLHVGLGLLHRQPPLLFVVSCIVFIHRPTEGVR